MFLSQRKTTDEHMNPASTQQDKSLAQSTWSFENVLTQRMWVPGESTVFVRIVIYSFLGFWDLVADVSELTIGSIFIGRWMKYVSGRIVGGIYIWLGLELGSGRANRNRCASAGRLMVSR